MNKVKRYWSNECVPTMNTKTREQLRYVLETDYDELLEELKEAHENNVLLLSPKYHDKNVCTICALILRGEKK